MLNNSPACTPCCFEFLVECHDSILDYVRSLLLNSSTSIGFLLSFSPIVLGFEFQARERETERAVQQWGFIASLAERTYNTKDLVLVLFLRVQKD